MKWSGWFCYFETKWSYIILKLQTQIISPNENDSKLNLKTKSKTSNKPVIFGSFWCARIEKNKVIYECKWNHRRSKQRSRVWRTEVICSSLELMSVSSRSPCREFLGLIFVSADLEHVLTENFTWNCEMSRSRATNNWIAITTNYGQILRYQIMAWLF